MRIPPYCSSRHTYCAVVLVSAQFSPYDGYETVFLSIVWMKIEIEILSYDYEGYIRGHIIS